MLCRGIALRVFFPSPFSISIILESISFDFFFALRAAKVRSSCEEGPGQSALQSAYHNPHLDVTELKQQNNEVIQAKTLQNKLND